ncbi:IclR family transcriptional regulator [Tateyamaria sp.]|uniref:IclR family transcriptional regulator n=1 Tax=Tateyamaria sp. TaxID=1929288 RepID=UPI00329E2888
MSTIAKAFELLELFTDARPRLGLSDVQRLTARDKATLHRHLVALEKIGFLEQDSETRAYCLGPTLTRLAGMRARTVPEVEMVRTVVDALSREAGELVHVSRLRGFDLVDVYHAEHHSHPVRVSFDAYGLPPLFATASGKAFLAFSPASKLIEALDVPRTWVTPENHPDKTALRAELDAIARCGYARSRDTLRTGVSSVAIPLFDANHVAVATCAIAFPTGRGGVDAEQRLAGLLMAAGAKMSRALGGDVPRNVQDIWTANYEKAAL